MERIPTPTFDSPVQWLRVGDMQLHLFLDDGPAPPRHHLGITIDDFDAAYEAVKARASDTWGWQLVELPSRQLQLYFRDPSDNLIELNWPDADDARPVALSRAAADRGPHPAEGRLGGSRPLPLRGRVMETALRRPGRDGGGARSPRRSGARCGIAGWAMLAVLAVLPVLWVLFFAPTTGKFATSFGSAVHDPKDFLITVLNGVTAAGLYFVVASGFTLIFGLMRVVNMAHGAFFLLGGYVALKLQRAHGRARAARSG